MSSTLSTDASSVGKRVQSSSVWVFAAYFTQQGVRLATNLILTRIFLPDVFALMALVLIVMMGVEMLSDVGIRTSLLRDENSEKPEFYQTAWTLKVIRGILLALLVVGLATPVSQFYEQPQLRELLFAVALLPILHGFEHVALHLAERRLTYFKVFLAHVSEPLVAAPIGIFLAITYESVWALVAMALVGFLARMIVGFYIFRDTPLRFRLERKSAMTMVHFGKWILLSTALTWLMYQIDRLSLGRLVPLETLGIYSIALMWAEVPLLAGRRWIGGIYYPLVANWFRNDDNAGSLSVRYRRVLIFTASVPFGIGLGLAGGIMAFLYIPPFTESATFLTVLLIATWIGVMEELYAQMLAAWGLPQKRMWACLSAVITFVVCMYPLFELYGAWGIALARVLAAVALLTTQFFSLRAYAPVSLVYDVAATVLMLCVAGATWLIYESLSKIMGASIALLLCAAVGGAVVFMVARTNRERIFTNPGR